MLEFLMLGPKEIDGSGRVQIQTIRFHTMKLNPNNRISLSSVWMSVLNLDRSAVRVNIHNVNLKSINIDHSALKCNLHSIRINVLNTSEI